MTETGPFALEDWSIAAVLRRQSQRYADKTLLRIGNESMTYAQAWDNACRVNAHLSAQGIGEGEFVAVMLRNDMAFCSCWLGLAVAGAVHVAINTDYMGEFLRHALNNCKRPCHWCVVPYHIEQISA